MNYFIRPETQKDYYRIAEINALAFASFIENPAERSFIAEVTLVDSLRHSANFDPDLALVAEWEGEVVGYALFTPYKVWIGGHRTNGCFACATYRRPENAEKRGWRSINGKRACHRKRKRI